MRTLHDGRVPPCAQCGVTEGDLPHVSRLIAELWVTVVYVCMLASQLASQPASRPSSQAFMRSDRQAVRRIAARTSHLHATWKKQDRGPRH